MLVAWRRVHCRKGMRCGGTAWEESRGAGASGEDICLGVHYNICGYGFGKDNEDGDIKIEDWPLPERPLIECGVGWTRRAVCRCRPSLTGESDVCGWLVFRVWWQQRANCVVRVCCCQKGCCFWLIEDS